MQKKKGKTMFKNEVALIIMVCGHLRFKQCRIVLVNQFVFVPFQSMGCNACLIKEFFQSGACAGNIILS